MQLLNLFTQYDTSLRFGAIMQTSLHADR